MEGTHLNPFAAIDGLQGAARQLAEEAWAIETSRAYQSQWKMWLSHCAEHGLTVLPASQVEVANWVSERYMNGAPAKRRRLMGQEGQSLSTIKVALAAIRAFHLRAGFDFDTRAPELRLVLRGATRHRIEAPAVSLSLPPATIKQVVDGLGDSLTDVRDSALLLLGSATGFRRGELAGLDWQSHGSGTGVLRCISDELQLELLRAKGTPRVLRLRGADHSDVVRTLEAWVGRAARVRGSPLFVRISGHDRLGSNHLAPHSIAFIVKRRIAEFENRLGHSSKSVDEHASHIAGHSLRRGLARELLARGKNIADIQTEMGHRDLRSTLAYLADCRG